MNFMQHITGRGKIVTGFVLALTMIAMCWPCFALNKTALKHYKRGRVLRDQGDLDGAIEAYKRALAIDPDYADAHYSLGYAYHLKAARMNPAHPRDLNTSQPVQTYLKKWKYGIPELQLAIKEFKEVIRLQPRAADAHFKLGVVYDNKGDYERACAEYRRAIELDPKGLDGQDARSNLALVLHAIFGKRDEAVDLLEATLRINPKDKLARQILRLIKQSILPAGKHEAKRQAKDQLVVPDIKPQEPAKTKSKEPKPGEERNFDGMKFVWIPAGEFRMGSSKGERDWAVSQGAKREELSDEGPVRTVRITKGFWMGKYEVTQAQYERVMGKNPSYFKGSNRPVGCVSWNDWVEFCEKMAAKSTSGGRCRLPTEAEWEYACRAGTTTKFYGGDSLDDLARAGWYSGYWGSAATQAVGKKEANAWGLYDMHGNAYELCSDWYSEGYYGTRPNPDSDPTGPSSGSYRVVRGGSWTAAARFCRSASRTMNDPRGRDRYSGFRVVRSSD